MFIMINAISLLHKPSWFECKRPHEFQVSVGLTPNGSILLGGCGICLGYGASAGAEASLSLGIKGYSLNLLSGQLIYDSLYTPTPSRFSHHTGFAPCRAEH